MAPRTGTIDRPINRRDGAAGRRDWLMEEGLSREAADKIARQRRWSDDRYKNDDDLRAALRAEAAKVKKDDDPSAPKRNRTAIADWLQANGVEDRGAAWKLAEKGWQGQKTTADLVKHLNKVAADYKAQQKRQATRSSNTNARRSEAERLLRQSGMLVDGKSYDQALADFQRKYKVNAGNAELDNATLTKLREVAGTPKPGTKATTPKPGTPGSTAAPARDVDSRRAVTRPTTTPPRPTGGTAPTPGASGGFGGGSFGGGSGGGTTPARDLKPEELRQRIRDDFPAYAWLLDTPEVGKLLEQAVKEGFTPAQFQARLQGTNWWKTTSNSVRTWETTLHTDPAKAKAMVEGQMVVFDNWARTFGVEMDEADRRQLADSAIRFGWNESQVKAALAKFARKTGSAFEGEGGYTADNLMALARKYGVPLSQGDAQEFALRMYEGSSSEEAFTDYLRTQAEKTWGYDQQLVKFLQDGGQTIQWFAAHKQAIADALEADPNTIDIFGDPRWRQVLDFVDPETKQRRTMTWSEARALARKQPEFRKTRQWETKENELGMGLLNFLTRGDA